MLTKAAAWIRALRRTCFDAEPSFFISHEKGRGLQCKSTMSAICSCWAFAPWFSICFRLDRPPATPHLAPAVSRSRPHQCPEPRLPALILRFFRADGRSRSRYNELHSGRWHFARKAERWLRGLLLYLRSRITWSSGVNWRNAISPASPR